ncbi:MAG: DUF2851 family protein [Prevotellaceae bacterium]|nr:DUF2851 family protein [Candidatus Minthosoma caballi]
MEQLLHYVWKHKIFPLRQLTTTDGREIEVLNPGLHNTNAGPDFLDAKVKIDGTVWVGNVEIHQRTSDWFRHHHDKDAAYENIILHVATDVDQQLAYPNGQLIPQLQLSVPSYVSEHYVELFKSDHQPRCSEVVGTLPLLMVHNWLTSLTLERFEQRTTQIMERREKLNKNWEDTLFVTIARNFGFGINGDAFEAWASSIPMSAVGKHRDDLFQIEAIFFGQAGLLNEELKIKNEESATEDVEYYNKLRKEYKYLRQKFTLTPIDPKLWRFLRLRPQNFPHVRIAQLAMLYYEQHLNLSRLLNAETLDEVHALFDTHVSDFWRTHYTFDSQASKPAEKSLSKSSLALLTINSVAPILFAYGKYKSNQPLCDRAFSLWESIKPESNHIIRNWVAAGVACENAADSQALIQLTRSYCEPHECLRCKFGYEFIRRTPGLLREE